MSVTQSDTSIPDQHHAIAIAACIDDLFPVITNGGELLLSWFNWVILLLLNNHWGGEVGY